MTDYAVVFQSKTRTKFEVIIGTESQAAAEVAARAILQKRVGRAVTQWALLQVTALDRQVCIDTPEATEAQ